MLASLCSSTSLGRDEGILLATAAPFPPPQASSTSPSTSAVNDSLQYDLDEVILVHVDEFATKPWEFVDASDEDDDRHAEEFLMAENDGADDWNVV